MAAVNCTLQTRIGTAGWSAPRAADYGFPTTGSHLERYSTRLCCAEINTSFYRPHRRTTYSRWAASVPPGFQFAVKAPRAMTHELRLENARAPLETFVHEVRALGEALGPILVQLPPSLLFDAGTLETFLGEFRALYDGPVVIEPRHPSWFEATPDSLLRRFEVARAAADPLCCKQAGAPGGWLGLRYWRLHGSPRMYFTPYGETRLIDLAAELQAADWCIFDNTASGAAVIDALLLQDLCRNRRRSEPAPPTRAPERGLS